MYWFISQWSALVYCSCIAFFVMPLLLTCVPELFVPIHGEDDQHISEDVHHDGEDQHAGQRSGHSTGGSAQLAAALISPAVRSVRIPYLQIHLPSGCSGHDGQHFSNAQGKKRDTNKKKSLIVSSGKVIELSWTWRHTPQTVKSGDEASHGKSVWTRMRFTHSLEVKCGNCKVPGLLKALVTRRS